MFMSITPERIYSTIHIKVHIFVYIHIIHLTEIMDDCVIHFNKRFHV